jgi:hypothetical protein
LATGVVGTAGTAAITPPQSELVLQPKSALQVTPETLRFSTQAPIWQILQGVVFTGGARAETVPQTLAHSDGEFVCSQVWQAFGVGIGIVLQTLAHSEGECVSTQASQVF